MNELKIVNKSGDWPKLPRIFKANLEQLKRSSVLYMKGPCARITRTVALHYDSEVGLCELP